MKIIFMLVVSIFFGLSNEKTLKKEDKNSIIEKKLHLLEKKVENLEKKVIVLEKKIYLSTPTEDFYIKFISKDIIEGKNKGIIKIEALMQNQTQKTVKFIFGQIHIIDTITKRELFSDNFYYDKPLQPSEYAKIIIAVPSSHPSYEDVKDSTNLNIKFTPKIVKN